MSEKNDILLREALEKYTGHVFLYYGEINREGYGLLSSAIEFRIERKEKTEKACLILITPGGNADAAFRIARAMRHHYSFLDVLIPDVCKSAGTLICIAADRLIFGDRGEIGPLDVQIFKPDELSDWVSGLDIFQSLTALQNQMLESFRDSFVYIRRGTRLRIKVVAEFANELAKAFISPIVGKIDPVTLGQHQRALQIASDYGKRLNEMSRSMKPGALRMLVEGYPDHGFVIDRREARERLFKNVNKPDADESMVLLYEWARTIIPQEQSVYDSLLAKDPPRIEDLGREQPKQTKDSDESQSSQETRRSGRSSQSGKRNVESSQPSQKTQRSGKSSQSGSKAEVAEVKKEVDQSG